MENSSSMNTLMGSPITERDMAHGIDWSSEDLTRWLLTEKFNGCRAYWDGASLWSRGGIAIRIPDAWKSFLPDIHLDCELYDGLDGVYRCTDAILHGRFTPSMRLVVFDVPRIDSAYTARMWWCGEVSARTCEHILIVPPIIVCEGNVHALQLLREVQARGGEGLVARSPNHRYMPGRTREILKLKNGKPE